MAVAVHGVAASLRGDPAIAGVHPAAEQRNTRGPIERASPGKNGGDSEDSIRTAGLRSIRMKEAEFAEEFAAGHSEQGADAGILEGRDAEAAALETRGEPSGDADAERALGVEKEPPLRMAALAIGEFAG